MSSSPRPDHRTTLSRLDRWLVGAALSMVALLVLISVVGWLFLNLAAIRSAFAPPVVHIQEAYADSPEPPRAVTFDHSAWDQLLQRHVDAAGWVDYDGMERDAQQLDQYLDSLGDAPFDQLSRDGKLALWLNVYNAATVRLILDHRPIDSIKDITEPYRWEDVRWTVAGRTYSLAQIEHDQIRPKFIEPRVHFALVCAAASCPPLRNEAYTAARLEAQLADQVAYTFAHPRWMRFGRNERDQPVVAMTPLLQWYSDDFQQVSGTVAKWLKQHVPRFAELVQDDQPPIIRWLPYDWSLNDVSNREAASEQGGVGGGPSTSRK